MWSGVKEGRAHSPELVIAHVLAHVIVVTRVLIIARFRSWALAAIREPRWPFWLVIRGRRGSWAMVKGARRWVVVAACGQWMVGVIVHGQWAVVLVGGGCERLVMVVGGGGVGVVVGRRSSFVATCPLFLM